jgi:hypothetical protein
MTRVTIVGSGFARRPLPLAREAVERAIRMCAFWDAETPLGARARGFTSVTGEDPADYEDHFDHHWLPTDRLRERLRRLA